MFLTANMAGAFTSYQSFFVKGSTLGGKKGREGRGERSSLDMHLHQVPKELKYLHVLSNFLLSFQHVSDNTHQCDYPPQSP